MGSVVISVDGELAWGYHDLFPLSAEQRQRISIARDRWYRLIELFDQYEIPATWAVVGHLLTADGGKYRREHTLGDDWFATAKNRRQRRPDEWDGSALVDQVQTATVDHEIASHSFSHPEFTEISAAAARAECRLSREIGNDHDLGFESFVFPRNVISHRDILAETGFLGYRGRQPTARQLPGVQGVAMLGGYVTGSIQPPLVEPAVDAYGLINVPASMFLGGFRDRPWSTLDSFAREPGTRLAKLGIDRASTEEGIFHLWLHPHDLTTQRYLDRMQDVLSYLATKRREENLRVETIRDVAHSVQANER
jgi:hypothetical protein